MDFENEFVAHRKIDIGEIASVEINRSKCDIIDLCPGKIAVVKRAIDERHGKKHALGKIAICKSATFEFFEIGSFPIVCDSAILGFEKVG